ncbi:MAG: DUF3109 family protein [Bacteroidota bacterium]
MLRVRNVLIDLGLLSTHFVCDLVACRGACCEEGDLGAPLLNEEVQCIRNELTEILPHINQNGRDCIAEGDFCEQTEEGEWVTQTVGGKACVFAVQDGGIWKCGIEKAHRAGATELLKPISCHLYPIRVEKVGSLDALYYHKWSICTPACSCGTALKVPVYQFLKAALTRCYGASWYEELEETALAYLQQRSIS